MQHANQMTRKRRGDAGFTLVEMIVAVGLFAIVMLVSVSTLLALVHANRKAQALQSVMNNLNIALDGMARAIREGEDYRCGSAAPADPNCAAGGTVLYFEPFCPDGGCSDWAYTFDGTTNRIYKSTDGGTNFLPLTAPEIHIDSLTFYVIGAQRTDSIQPKVMIVVKGTVEGGGRTTDTTFHVQSTAVQRVLDI